MKWCSQISCYIFCLLLMSHCSCSKNDAGKVYSPYELWDLAKAADPNIELVPIANNEESKRVLCIHYGPGCVQGSGRRIKVRKVELIAIQFETEAHAKAAAEKINQYYFGNWVLDNVRNEPVLEHFVTTALKARPAIDASGVTGHQKNTE